MIGLVTDSTAQMDDELADRLAVEVVPITVRVGEREFAERRELDPDAFYRMLDADPHLPLATSQPSPGEFADTYRRLVERGVDEIVSIHVSADLSGTLNSARIGAESLGVPVHLYDTGTVSFGVAAQVWAASDALAGGGSAAEAVAAAERRRRSAHTVFLLDACGIARTSARRALDAKAAPAGTAVLAGADGAIDQVGTADGVEAAVDTMVRYVDREAIGTIDAAVCLAHPQTEPITEALEARLGEIDKVRNTVRYRVGPSVAAYTGVDTAGCFFWPAEVPKFGG